MDDEQLHVRLKISNVAITPMKMANIHAKLKAIFFRLLKRTLIPNDSHLTQSALQSDCRFCCSRIWGRCPLHRPDALQEDGVGRPPPRQSNREHIMIILIWRALLLRRILHPYTHLRGVLKTGKVPGLELLPGSFQRLPR